MLLNTVLSKDLDQQVYALVNNITINYTDFDELIKQYNTAFFLHTYILNQLDNNTILELYHSIYTNKFLNNHIKIICLEGLFKAQKTLLILYKFKHRLYMKYIVKHRDIGESLCCIPLDTLNDTRKFNIIEDKSIFTFYINDLQTIINKSLTKSDNLFNKPTLPNNPYTNNPISLPNLYNLYIFYLDHKLAVPEIFYRFYKSKFCITKFLYENESYLRDIVISQYYNSINNMEKYFEIIIILRKYKQYIKNIQIHPDFDKNKIVEKFNNILTYELYILYSFNNNKQIYYKNKLINFLKEINRTNRMFGRILYQPFKKMDIKNTIKFNTNYKHNPKYYKADILSYKYKNIPNIQTIINMILNSFIETNNIDNRDNIDNSITSTIRYHFTSPPVVNETNDFDDYGEEINRILNGPIETFQFTNPNNNPNNSFSANDFII